MRGSDGSKWGDHLTVQEVRARAEMKVRRRLARISLEKNYSEFGPDAPHRQLIEMLQKCGYQVIVLMGSHSSAVVVVDVIRTFR